MRTIHMVDLFTQHDLIRTELDQALKDAINSAAYINGPQVQQFAQQLAAYIGVKHVIPCANGTDALQVALMALELPKGSEVIVPAFNYVATAEVIALLDFKCNFVDVGRYDYEIDIDKLEAAVTPQTKAIIPVHLFGQCANMEPILAFAKRHNLYVIEDTAQAIGAEYTFSNGTKAFSGTMGHIGTTSFFPSKNLGCMGDGGAIFTNDDHLADTLRCVVNHGQRVRYLYEKVGVNSRLDTLQAAILSVKLRNLPRYTANRQAAAAHYDEKLSGNPQLVVPARSANSTHVFHQYTLQVLDGRRDALKDYLGSIGIPSMVYYPGPIHTQEAYEYAGYKEGDFPVSEEISKQVLSLPMHSELDEEQLNYITSSIINFMNS